MNPNITTNPGIEVLVNEETETKNQTPWKVVIYNDDVNTFEWVIQCLMEVCKHKLEQAEQCAMIIHFKGKCNVKSGDYEDMASICQALCDRQLSAEIEES